MGEEQPTVDRDVYQEWFDLETYHWWFVGRRHLFAYLIDGVLQQEFREHQSPFLIADMGCGTGVNLDVLARG